MKIEPPVDNPRNKERKEQEISSSSQDHLMHQQLLC